VKQSKVSNPLPPVRPSTPRGARYRYFTTLPSVVTLRLRDLQIPEQARTSGYDSEQFVDLPCADIFGGAQPKIRLGRLAELAPEGVTGTDHPDQFVRVCSARLALAYAITEGREKLEEPPEPTPEAKAAPEPGKEPAKKDTPAEKPTVLPSAAEKPTASDEPAKPSPAAAKGGFWQRLRADKPADEPATPPPAAPDSAKEPVAEKPSAAKVDPGIQPADLPPPPKAEPKIPAAPEDKKPAEIPAPARAADAPPELPEAPAKPASLPPPPPPDVAAEKKPDEPKAEDAKTEELAGESARKPFSLFPLFRRKEPVDTKPPVALPPPPTPPATRGRIEIPKPKRRTMAITLPPRDPEAAEAAKAAGPSPEVQPPAPPPPVIPPPPVAEKPPAAPEAPRIPLPPVLKTEPVEAPGPRPEPPKPAPVADAAPPVAKPSEPAPVAPVAAIQPELPQSPAAPKPPEPQPPVKESGKAVEAVLEPAAVLVETEHWPKPKTDLPEQDALQAIFLTEEFLSVDRVVELCGGLPGITSCVLSHGATVIASHNTPDSVDIVSLSAHALEMLKAMRGSAAKMGIGAVPAVTVHSEKGPITFFHQDDLCLLVLHKDRGFVPGVREKLQQVVNELGRAQLPVPVGKKALGR
jgi:predicted regulator of Ras-like GTPase activity (Roadblock/LC7/MglB family)